MERKKVLQTLLGCCLLAVFVFVILMLGTRQCSAPAADPSVAEPPETPSAGMLTTGTTMLADPTTPEPTPTPEPTVDPNAWLPDIDIESWEFRLANSQNSIGEYVPELTEMENGQFFDSRAADALNEFMEAARAEGLNVYLSSTYRDFNTQKYLYDRKVSEYGEAIAKTIVSPPGTSEHQLGLAADVTDKYYEYKNETLADTELYKWMSAHCHEYGFIVRYPKDKTETTGVMYEPWHFRYVGTAAAAFIMENGLCLEEFIALYTEQIG